MKKLLFFLLVLAAVQVKAQVIKGSIDLRDSTISRSIPFEVAAGTKSVKYDIKVYTAIGAVTVALTDPSGKKSVNITIGSDARNGGHESSKGEMIDDVKVKIPGTWKFNIDADHATGKISYEIEVTKP